MVTDEELFIRWLEVAAFLPVLSFHTPPWVYGEEQVGSCLGTAGWTPAMRQSGDEVAMCKALKMQWVYCLC